MKTPKKAEAARRNGKMGGRTKSTPNEVQQPSETHALKKEAAMKNADQRTKRIADKSAYKFARKIPMRKISKKKEKVLRTQYYPAQKDFLARNPVCIICLSRGISPPNPATEIHHIFGRAGANLTDERGWASSCYGCRQWPHENPRQARELGVLGESRHWNVPIDRHLP